MQAPQAKQACARGGPQISCKPPAQSVCNCAPNGRRRVSSRALRPTQSPGRPSVEARCGCLASCSHARHAFNTTAQNVMVHAVLYCSTASTLLYKSCA